MIWLNILRHVTPLKQKDNSFFSFISSNRFSPAKAPSYEDFAVA